MTDNKQRYEILASNGQVLEHGFASRKSAMARMKEYQNIYPEDNFSIRGYDKGKYGNE